jgi:predicted Zn-dependent protease
LRGTAAFIEQQGRVYQLLGYSAASTYGATSPTLVAAINSFGPVSDPAVLDVRPKRIDIVEVQQRQSLAQFADRFSSAVGAEQLAVLNQLPGASTVIDAGTLVKRVTT